MTATHQATIARRDRAVADPAAAYAAFRTRWASVDAWSGGRTRDRYGSADAYVAAKVAEASRLPAMRVAPVEITAAGRERFTPSPTATSTAAVEAA